LIHLPAVLARAFGVSRSEARRSIAQGAVRIDLETVPPTTLEVAGADLDGRVLQLGKRHFVRVRVL
jgi:tyrosyl-tRNA synthetase